MVTPVQAAGDRDPLDARLGHVSPPAEGAWRRWPSRRLALGLSPMPSPGLALLLLGIAFGPRGLGVLTDSALMSLDPAISVALAALGAFVGLDLQRREPRLLAAASVEASVTALTVGLGVLLVHWLSPTADAAPWLLAVLLGLCASPSSTAAGWSGEPGVEPAGRVGDLDDVLPVVLGAFAFGWMRQESSGAAAWLVAQGGIIALAVATASWLLVAQASSESEKRVFALGALLLLGGTAAHLSLPALFAGFVAGGCWNRMGAAALAQISRDLRYLQHPLIVLLLVVAGARLAFSPGLAGLTVAYVVFRLAGKLAGGWGASRLSARDLPRGLGFSLNAPGIVGIALALNVLQAAGETAVAATVFGVVVVGSFGSELLSLAVSRGDRP
jgi:hypothetical protein